MMTEREVFRRVYENITHPSEKGFQSSWQAESRGDPGGETKDGISQRFLDRVGGWEGKHRPKYLTPKQIQDIYWQHFWRTREGIHRLSAVSYPLAMAAFDFGVQSSPRRAMRFLQMVVKTPPDGIFGPITERAIYRRGDVPVLLQYVAKRREFLARWIQGDPKRTSMTVGLMRRMDRVTFECMRVAIVGAVPELWHGPEE